MSYIEVKDYSKIITGKSVLKNINIRMESGNIYGFKGKNASGKTMLMRAICGLILPTSGEVVINDEVVGKDISFPRSVGALIENPGFLNDYSAFKNLRILADIKGEISDQDIKNVIEQVGLDPEDKMKYKKFSLGMKQKLGIAAAIMENPDIIILDEPTNALDTDSIEKLRQIIKNHKERGALIILSSHDAEELEMLSDHIFFIESGECKNENREK